MWFGWKKMTHTNESVTPIVKLSDAVLTTKKLEVNTAELTHNLSTVNLM